MMILRISINKRRERATEMSPEAPRSRKGPKMIATTLSKVERSIPAVMPRLREGTADLHEAVERHPFQATLMAGRLPREAFAAFLGQMWLVHRCLEGELRRRHSSEESLRNVVQDYQFKVELLEQDLSYFGVRPDAVRATAATRRLVETIGVLSEARPLALLGMHYVLEGSTNGGKFVARQVSAAYGLTGPEGLRYLDPYGDKQRVRWQAFKNAMEEARFEDEEQEALLAAARRMFAAIGGICDELWVEAQRGEMANAV